MKSAITTKAKATTRLISTSFKVLSADIIDEVVAIERNNSSYPWPTEHFRSSLENSTNLSYALMLGDKLIGYVITALAIDSADILYIAIDSGYQRQGYATKLLSQLVSEFSEKGVKEVFLEARVSNEGAIGFYNSQGFKQISVRNNYYMKNSNDSTEREDGIIMRLEIATTENNNAL
jgi:ribosomal-protein-alanine acetyltransferase